MRVAFGSPWGALAGLAVLVPLAALLVKERRSRRVRRTLGLEAPPRRAQLPAVAAALSAFALLGAAAAQPSIRVESTIPVRGDAQVFVLFDITRSMLAAGSPGAPTRFERAVRFALRLRRALSGVPVGVASITNRPLPHLFPTADESAFAATVTRVVGVNRPPPGADLFRRTTSFESIEAFANENFFSPQSIRRLVVLLSDGESHGFAPRSLSRKLEAGGVELIVVRFWSPGERIWLPGGGSDPGYRPDPLAHPPVAELAALTTGGRIYEEAEFARAAAAARAYLGSGSESTLTSVSRARPLGLYVALGAGLPLAFLVARGTGGSRSWPFRAGLHTVCSARARHPRG